MSTTGQLRLRRENITWTATGDEVVVLDLRSSQYLQLNASATPLWHNLVNGATQEALTATLTDLYGLVEADAAANVAEFIAQLEAHDLLLEC